MSVSVIVNVPKQGYSVTEQKQVVDALVAYLTASSGAKVTQLLGGEI
jgi:DNA-binding winged helix-turn-helix (wHTH) protein